MNKIVIGTANFNSNYGFEKRRVSKKNIKKIITFAKKNRIINFDTAIDYSIPKNFFQFKNQRNFKIISKFNIPKKNSKKFIKNFENKILHHINYIGINNLEGLLFHNIQDIKNKNFNHLINIIKLLKKKKIIKKFGFSIYNPNEINLILNKVKPDIIQAPLNLFDQRILNQGYLNILKKKKIEIHIRSIFLQGTLVSPINQIIKSKLPFKLLEKIRDLEKFCKKNNITRLEICSDFINKIKKIDKIIIGTKNDSQLEKIVYLFKNQKKKKLSLNYDQFQQFNTKIIDPRKWKKIKE